MSGRSGEAPRGRTFATITIYLMALCALGLVTIAVVQESPLAQEGGETVLLSQGAAGFSSAKVGAGKGSGEPVEEDDLFDLLTAPDQLPIESSTAQPSAVLTATTIVPTELTIETPAPGDTCLERGTPQCKTVTPTCKRQGPVCTYQKMCVAKSTKCHPDGICTQPGKQCNYAFSKSCITCAKTTSTCQKAHNVAAACVPECEKSCMKDATCETKCAQGCLKKYKAFIGQCKKLCPPCQEGAVKQVCWDSCNSWKSCETSADKCSKVNVCSKKGERCAFMKHCAKWEKRCSTVKTCAYSAHECKKTTSCVRRDTKCSHEVTPACSSCQKTSKTCEGHLRVKERCYGDCDVHCKTAKPRFAKSCHNSCIAGCHASESALGKLCYKKCPACKKASKGCHLKCLQKETKQTCGKVCKKHVEKQECKKTCAVSKMKKKCVSVCASYKPQEQCKKTCQKWGFSPQRPCTYPCQTHGFQQVCSPEKTHCTEWTGGKVCDKGPCLRYKKLPFFPAAPGPVIMPPTASLANSTAQADYETSFSDDASGKDGLPPGAVPPVSSNSKLGRVMREATDDVFRLLGGADKKKAAAPTATTPLWGN